MAYRPQDPAHARPAYAACLVAHEGQFRKGERASCLVHPRRVAELRAHAGAADDAIAAGMLHDVLEDERRLGSDLWDRFSRPREEQRWHHQSLLEIFLARASEDAPLGALAERQRGAVLARYGWR